MCIPRCRDTKPRYHQLESVDDLQPRPFSPNAVRTPQTTKPAAFSSRLMMGAPPPARQTISPSPNPIRPTNTLLAAQHERLILELLPFKDSQTFHEWLQSDQVRGSFHEFTRDLLQKDRASPQQHFPDPDKEQTAKAAKEALEGKSPKYLLYHPDKSGWTPEEHHVRFIVTVAQDSALMKTWSLKKEGPFAVAKSVYEVLCYLKASLVVADPNPPGYTQ